MIWDAVAALLLAFGPGWAVLRHVAIDDLLERVVLAVAVSLALSVAVVATLMYAGWWSPGLAGAVLLLCMSRGGGGRAVLRGRRR